MGTDNNPSVVELNVIFYEPFETHRKLDIHFALDKNNITFSDYVSCMKKAAILYGFSPTEIDTVLNTNTDIEPSYVNSIPLTN